MLPHSLPLERRDDLRCVLDPQPVVAQRMICPAEGRIRIDRDGAVIEGDPQRVSLLSGLESFGVVANQPEAGA